MSADGDADTSRTSVRTYVPAYQKAAWERQADRLDMSLSEFVRSMVQAGRRGFEGDVTGHTSSDPPAEDSRELETQIVTELRDRGCCSWDDLVTAVTDDIESELEQTVQESERIQHSPRQGGYVLEDV